MLISVLLSKLASLRGRRYFGRSNPAKLFLIIAFFCGCLFCQPLFAAESDSITLKVTVSDLPPEGSLLINNGAVYTKSAAVTLNLSATDAGSAVDKMCFSHDNLSWSVPEDYAATKNWMLTPLNGEKTVYVKFKDTVGNWSNVYSDKIILDTLPPVIISSWPAKDSYVGSQGGSVTLNIVFGDATSGINPQQVKLSDENGMDITWSTQVSENNIEYIIATPANKQYKFKLYLEDNAGNNLLEEFAFTVDSTIPEVSVDTMGGTFAEPLTVKLQCSEQATIYYSTDGYPPIEGNANTTAVTGTSANIAINKTTNLQFFALDPAGNRSATKTETYRFNELPIPPFGLQGFYNESAKRVELQWQAAAGAAGYYVYRASNIQEIGLLNDSNARKYAGPVRLRLSSTLGISNVFYDVNAFSGTTYWYGVSVVDTQGVESPVSELISVKASEQQPIISKEEATRRALAWIEANQKPQGYWGERKEIQMLATSQILNALSIAYQIDAANRNLWIYRSLFWLRGNFADNNDYLARKIIVLRNFRQNTDEEINRLMGESDLVGTDIHGWGVQKRYGNDAVCTAFGKMAIEGSFWRDRDKTTSAGASYTFTFLSPSTGYIDRYGWVPGKDTSIFVSALSYHAMGVTSDVMAGAPMYVIYQHMYQWIMDSQNADGSYGNGAIDTSAVLLWLSIPLSNTAKTNAITYIISQQYPDGSWSSGDAYVTGLCLEALLSS